MEAYVRSGSRSRSDEFFDQLQAFTTRQCRQRHYVFGLSVRIRAVRTLLCLSVFVSAQIFLLQYLMNAFNSFDKNLHSVAPTDDLIVF